MNTRYYWYGGIGLALLFGILYLKRSGGYNILEKFTITPSYLPVPSKRRSGQKMKAVKFIVAHDTGNPRSTAKGNVGYYRNTANDIEASAHIFVDDKDIIECIPALTGPTPEKAWHVRYNAPSGNKLGMAANDYAIGVEYCYGDNINADEAYKRYVWVLAYICNKYHLNPATDIAGHFQLDPGRKTDPVTGLADSGRTFPGLLADVASELANFRG